MDTAFSSTVDLAAAIAKRKISAVEALDAHLAQIDAHNEVVNAVISRTGKAPASVPRRRTLPRRAAPHSDLCMACRSR
jgi:Asp-tRNA(Asn)/Glu-tRNA(Gln) amidotransferase A subunit family amidase